MSKLGSGLIEQLILNVFTVKKQECLRRQAARAAEIDTIMRTAQSDRFAWPFVSAAPLTSAASDAPKISSHHGAVGKVATPDSTTTTTSSTTTTTTTTPIITSSSSSSPQIHFGPQFVFRPPHSAVLLRGTRLVGKAHTNALNVAIASHARNYRRVLYGDDERSIHAEARAVAHAVSAFVPTTRRGRLNAQRRKRHSAAIPNGILVARFSRNGEPRDSRPCADCVVLLREAGLRFAVYWLDGYWHKDSIASLLENAKVSRTVLVARDKRRRNASSSSDSDEPQSTTTTTTTTINNSITNTSTNTNAVSSSSFTQFSLGAKDTALRDMDDNDSI
jgi:hypothetical protein